MEPEAYLREVAWTLTPNLREICLEVISDARFQTAPGGSTHHHNYKGGLIKHTAEVTKFALDMVNAGNREIVATASIVHDRSKIFEYVFNEEGKIVNQPYRKLIGHVVGSYTFFLERAKEHDVNLELIDAIGHCLLAHHGRLEWRSPVEPQTPEAFILHSADMLSARAA